MKYALSNLNKLITLRDDRQIFGANQEWYGTCLQRLAGCGPVAASTLIAYTTEEKPFALRRYEDWKPLMDEVWDFVTPGLMGLNSTRKFVFGCNLFFQKYRLPFTAADLYVSAKEKPDLEEVKAFITESLGRDCPVAFLNLSNGSVKNLQSWHWITIVGLEETENGSLLATALDEENLLSFDLSLWCKTTRHSGGFVTFQKKGTTANSLELLPQKS